MIFFTLLYLFTIKLINAEKNPIFELTESDPAFAFHGVRLNQAETITIKTSVASNFEIIYSQAGCTNHNKGMCDDTIPFNISLADSLLIGTDSRNCSDLSTSEILVTLYIWVYNVDQRTELTFNKTSSESIFEFAVSIRVREWIDESMSLLLIPGIQGGNHKNSIGIIVLETEIVTVVANPNTYEWVLTLAENLDKFNFWTPYYYPWIFDQQLQVEMLRKTGKTAQTFIAVQTKTSRTSREIQLEIVKIDGITLYLTAHPTNDGDFECGKVNTFYKSYSTEKATVPIVPPAETFEAYCLNITWTFNSSLFESTSPIGFMLKLTAKPLIRTFELTKRTPSFAIHGDRLMQFEQIEITYHNCTGVIVDWTIDECQQPNGTLCLDPSPFKVDGSIWDMPELFLSLKENSDRVEWASQVDHQIKGVFWTNFLPQPAEGDFGSVTLSSSQNYGRSVTYAVSVRVPDWIKETKKVLLIPGMSTGNEKRNTIDDPLTNATKFDYLIVKGNVTATIIPHPDNYAWYGPWSIMRSINRVPPFSPQKNCQAFKDSQTLSPNCPDKTIFESYAGAEPGLDRLDEHRLASGSFTPTSDMVEFTFRGNCIASSFCPDLSLNESLGFMLKITEEPRTFQLDLQTPSFAIHGARLSTFFAIEISTNVSVNFLIDITQNDCKNKRDNAGEEICDDLLPILIDDDSLAPFGSIADNGTFGYFYKSQHKLEHKLVFLIRHNPDVDFLEYGISIRVEEWINENKSVLVIPGIENQGDDFYIMIQEDVIATVVDSPTTDNAENFLLYSTSTAASVFSNDQCSFCLHFDTRKPEQSYQGVSYLNIERFSILTPPFFPWIHDTSEKIGYFQNSQFIIAGELSNQTTDMSYFKARIKRLQGVTVTMFAYSELHCLADNDNDETFHESVNSKQAPEWSFQAKCIRLSWEPNKTYDEETGFLIEIQEVEKEKEKAKGKSLAWIWIASVVTGIICTIICIVGYKTRLFIRLFRSKDAKRDEKFGVFMNIYRKAKSIDRNQSKWEIDPSSLVVTSKKLGSGSFAVVYEGSIPSPQSKQRLE
ncbi:unnamed protein product, partial [Mesorhabditis belari]|uniref:Uncharacterized protein n=1 Tax=Mesorhabditis belari TaxID=2138241 RepID=A0AAF3ERK0_9BILA